MKQLKFLMFGILFVALCGCSIFGNDDDDEDNTTPFEGSWEAVVSKLTFVGDKVSLDVYSQDSLSFTNSTFSYDQKTKKLKIDKNEDESHYMLSNNQLFLGDENSEDGNYYILSYQKLDYPTGSTLGAFYASDSVDVKDQPAFLNAYYKDKDLDSLINFCIISCDLILYDGVTCLAEIEIEDPNSFIGLAKNTPVSVTGFCLNLIGYDSDFKELSNEEYPIDKVTIESYSYDPIGRLEASFSELKKANGDNILDSLTLNVDFSDIDAFKKMLKDL